MHDDPQHPVSPAATPQPATPVQYSPPTPPPPGAGYPLPPGQYDPPPPPPSWSYPPQGYYPQDGNTSGMGEGYPVPPSVKGWNFAGFIPYGIFAFANGNAMWGAFGILANFLGLSLVYSIVLGIMGREIAWKGRRFDSLAQFEETMAAWNKWGIIILFVQVGAVALFIVFYISILAAVFAGVFGSM